VWKAYIDFEVQRGELEQASKLFERLLGKTTHIKVWLGYFWHNYDQLKSTKAARKVIERAQNHFREKEPDLKEERLMLLENWLRMEQKEHPEGSKHIDSVKAKFPKRVKKRRNVLTQEPENTDAQNDSPESQDAAQT